MSEKLEFDTDKIDEMALAILYFGMHRDRSGVYAWRGLAWEIMDRMFEKGWISDPKSKAKSVGVSEETEALAAELARKYFAPD